MTVLDRLSGPKDPVHQRGKRWYTIGGGLVLAAAAYGIVSGAWSLTIVSVVIGAMYFWIRNHQPVIHELTILEQGLLYDNRFLRWEDLQGFWFVQHNTFDLHVPLLNSPSHEELRIQLPREQSNHLRNVLARFLSELTTHTESFLDTIARICKL